jgi:hypothetical protein
MKAPKYQLKDHPWIDLLVVLMTLVFTLTASSIVLFEILKLNPEDSINQLLPATISNLLLVFVFMPLLYKLPSYLLVPDIIFTTRNPYSTFFIWF